MEALLACADKFFTLFWNKCFQDDNMWPANEENLQQLERKYTGALQHKPQRICWFQGQPDGLLAVIYRCWMRENTRKVCSSWPFLWWWSHLACCKKNQKGKHLLKQLKMFTFWHIQTWWFGRVLCWMPYLTQPGIFSGVGTSTWKIRVWFPGAAMSFIWCVPLGKTLPAIICRSSLGLHVPSPAWKKVQGCGIKILAKPNVRISKIWFESGNNWK